MMRAAEVNAGGFDGAQALSMDDRNVVQKMPPDDQMLIRRIVEGEIDLFGEVIGRHQAHVARIVTRHVPMDRVEEIAHDVFVRAYLHLAQFSGSVPFDHWLSGIAVRSCYDFWRIRKREELPVSALTAEHQQWMDHVSAAQSADQFHERARRREAAEVLEWALAQLSAENRMVLTLVHLDGYSVREAARLLGWTVVNVKVRSYRARQMLRKILVNDHRGTHDGTQRR
jgi:RNA polymerase sigma-70 factor (ECF subfamily)